MENYLGIGSRLKTIRGKRRQADFADELSIALLTYQRYERGERKPPADILRKIAVLGKTTMEWLLTGELLGDTYKSSFEQMRSRKTGIREVDDATDGLYEEFNKSGGQERLNEAHALQMALRQEPELEIMVYQLWSIYQEGNKEKLDMVKTVLKMADPGGKEVDSKAEAC